MHILSRQSTAKVACAFSIPAGDQYKRRLGRVKRIWSLGIGCAHTEIQELDYLLVAVGLDFHARHDVPNFESKQ